MSRAFEDENSPAEKEITLSTGALLAIFFALVLICGVFFGFGYSTGRHSGPAASISVAPTGEPADPASKPSAESTLAATRKGGASTPASSMAALDAAPPPSVPAAHEPAVPDAEAPATPPVAKPAKPAASVAVPATTLSPAPVQASRSAAPPAGSTPSMVQIAAVSHQEDADVLVAALGKRGYSVVVRNEPQDKLLHIQVGPFSSRQEADIVRRRLQADGYNAFIRQ